MEILLNNLEIDDTNSNCYLFTEKKLNLQKCKEIVKSHQITVYFGGVSSSGGFPPPCHFIS